jgi:hypothetical protein
MEESSALKINEPTPTTMDYTDLTWSVLTAALLINDPCFNPFFPTQL